VTSTHGRAVEIEEAAAFEDAVDDGGGEVIVVEDGAPEGGVLVGGEEHGASGEMAVVDDVEEHVSSVGAVGEVADFIDDEDSGVGVAGEGLCEAARAEGGGEVIDELGGGDEEGIEAILDGAVGDGDGEVGFASTGLADEEKGAAVGDEVGGEHGADEGEAERGLEGEVEVVDGLEEGEAGAASESLDTGLLAMSDLLGDEGGKEVAVRPGLGLGLIDEGGVDTASIGEVEAFEEGVEVEGCGGHRGSSSWEAKAREWAMYSASKRQSSRPFWKAAATASLPWMMRRSWRRSTSSNQRLGRR